MLRLSRNFGSFKVEIVIFAVFALRGFQRLLNLFGRYWGVERLHHLRVRHCVRRDSVSNRGK